MAKTTTINKKTGQRLKGVKAKSSSTIPLLDFKRSTEKSEYLIGKVVKHINNTIQQDKFWNFNYYADDGKEQRRINTKKADNYIYFLWNKYVRVPGDLKGEGIRPKNGSKINNTTVYTDRPYRFGRDILRPKFHVGFISPINQEFNFAKFNKYDVNGNLNEEYENYTKMKYGKDYNKYKERETYNKRLQRLNLQSKTEATTGPYANYHTNRVEQEYYFKFSNTYFWDSWNVQYQPLVANEAGSQGPFIKHSGVNSSLGSGIRTVLDHHYFYNVDGEELNKEKRVKYPLILSNISMGGTKNYLSQDMSIIPQNKINAQRPWIISNSFSISGRYAGLSRQEWDVETLTEKYVKVFNDFFGEKLTNQLQCLPADDGLYITRIKRGIKDPKFKQTKNYLYCLAQRVVQGRYYYNPATNEPDLSYLYVELVPEIL